MMKKEETHLWQKLYYLPVSILMKTKCKRAAAVICICFNIIIVLGFCSNNDHYKTTDNRSYIRKRLSTLDSQVAWSIVELYMKDLHPPHNTTYRGHIHPIQAGADMHMLVWASGLFGSLKAEGFNHCLTTKAWTDSLICRPLHGC